MTLSQVFETLTPEALNLRLIQLRRMPPEEKGPAIQAFGEAVKAALKAKNPVVVEWVHTVPWEVLYSIGVVETPYPPVQDQERLERGVAYLETHRRRGDKEAWLKGLEHLHRLGWIGHPLVLRELEATPVAWMRDVRVPLKFSRLDPEDGTWMDVSVPSGAWPMMAAVAEAFAVFPSAELVTVRRVCDKVTRWALEAKAALVEGEVE